MKIKICGVTSVPDARICVEEGADYVGLIFAEISPRKVTIAQARRIVRSLPKTVKSVAVVMNQSQEEVGRIVRETGVDYVQLHGKEDPTFARKVGVPIIKVFDRFSKRDLSRLRRYDIFAYMMDLPKTNGTAKRRATVDLSFATNAKNYGRVFLSGRLTPQNVAGLVKEINPFGVDVCSCTEKEPGKKDRRSVRTFIEAVRA